MRLDVSDVRDVSGEAGHLLRLGEGYERYGDLASARETLQRAYEEAREARVRSDPDAQDQLVRSLLALSRISWKLADLQSAQDYVERAVVEPFARGSLLEVDCYLSRARLLVLTGHERDALAVLDSIEGRCELISFEQLAELLNVRGIAISRLNMPSECMSHYEHAWRILSKRSQIDEKLKFLDCFAIAARDFGFMQRAVELHDEALALLEPEPGHSLVALTCLSAAASHLLLGNVAKARTLLDGVPDENDAMLDLDRAYVATILGLLTGDEEIAERAASRLDVGAACNIGAQHRIGQVAAARHRYLIAKRRRAEAEALIERTLPLLTTLDGSWWFVLELCLHHRRAKDLRRTSALLLEIGRESQVVEAHLALVEAALAGLNSDVRLSRLRALEASSLFKAISWRVHEAAALEMAGCRSEAAAIYGACRLDRELSRVKKAAHRSRLEGTRRSLTRRELDVFGLLREGKTDAEIARRLSISPRTAQQHVSWIMKKLDVLSRRDLRGTREST